LKSSSGGSTLCTATADSKAAMPYILNLAPMLSVFLGICLRSATGKDQFTFLALLVGFLGVPLADCLLNNEVQKPLREEKTKMIRHRQQSLHLYVYSWAYIASVVAVACFIGVESGFVGGGANRMSSLAFWGISTSMGVASGFGMGRVFELIGHPSVADTLHARMILAFCNNSHFWLLHFARHTTLTSRKGLTDSTIDMPAWISLCTRLCQSFIWGCGAEAKLQVAQGQGLACAQSHMISLSLISLTINAAILCCFGPLALAAHMVQSLLTALLTDGGSQGKSHSSHSA